jgi:hypothetical protein
MTSTIDRSIPSHDAALLASAVRANLNAAADDIEALQNARDDALSKSAGGTVIGKITASGGVVGLPAPATPNDAARLVDVQIGASGTMAFTTKALMDADSTHTGFARVGADGANNGTYYRASTGSAWGRYTDPDIAAETSRATIAETSGDAKIALGVNTMTVGAAYVPGSGFQDGGATITMPSDPIPAGTAIAIMVYMGAAGSGKIKFYAPNNDAYQTVRWYKDIPVTFVAGTNWFYLNRDYFDGEIIDGSVVGVYSSNGAVNAGPAQASSQYPAHWLIAKPGDDQSASVMTWKAYATSAGSMAVQVVVSARRFPKIVTAPDGAGAIYNSDFSAGVDGWATTGLTLAASGGLLTATANSGMTGQGPFLFKYLTMPAGTKIQMRIKGVSGGPGVTQYPSVSVVLASDGSVVYLDALTAGGPSYSYEPDGYQTLTWIVKDAATRVIIKPSGSATAGDITTIQRIAIGDLSYNAKSIASPAVAAANKLADASRYAGAANGIWNFEAARNMPPDLLRGMVEAASCGRMTVLFDDLGLPSMMYRIPAVSLGALNAALGDMNTVHPAFSVNGVLRKALYIGAYQSTLISGRMVSWPGLFATGGLTIAQARAACTAKGAGFHLMSAWERALLALLTKKLYGEPRGNTYYGRSHVVGFEAECAERLDGLLPGTDTFGQCIRHGSEPDAWSHNQRSFGIFDLIGNFWQFVDGFKLIDGQIYMPTDNYFSQAEGSWPATGAYFDFSGPTGNRTSTMVTGTTIFSNAISTYAETPTPSGGGDSAEFTYANQDSWKDVPCSAGYDTLSSALRLRLMAACISPRLTSNAASAIDLAGGLWARNYGTRYAMVGGAQEYGAQCGLGLLVAAFGAATGHSNIGSRLAFIS